MNNVGAETVHWFRLQITMYEILQFPSKANLVHNVKFWFLRRNMLFVFINVEIVTVFLIKAKFMEQGSLYIVWQLCPIQMDTNTICLFCVFYICTTSRFIHGPLFTRQTSFHQLEHPLMSSSIVPCTCCSTYLPIPYASNTKLNALKSLFVCLVSTYNVLFMPHFGQQFI